jgi:hypothetical protein
MLGRSHHASELQALLGVLTIFFYFGANHETSPQLPRPKTRKAAIGSTALCPSEGWPRACVHVPAFGLLPLEPPREP